jgi:hypothetical protein
MDLLVTAGCVHAHLGGIGNKHWEGLSAGNRGWEGNDWEDLTSKLVNGCFY